MRTNMQHLGVPRDKQVHLAVSPVAMQIIVAATRSPHIQLLHAATSEKPAADTAAMVSTALAMLAHYFRTTPDAGAYMSNKLANSCEAKAMAAYKYAKEMYTLFSEKSTCSMSAAVDNCVGDCGGGFKSVRALPVAVRFCLRP